jgi:hypothetical protein
MRYGSRPPAWSDQIAHAAGSLGYGGQGDTCSEAPHMGRGIAPQFIQNVVWPVGHGRCARPSVLLGGERHRGYAGHGIDLLVDEDAYDLREPRRDSPG